jgi:uncharacterized protein YmfQ (DUF2313 family)
MGCAAADVNDKTLAGNPTEWIDRMAAVEAKWNKMDSIAKAYYLQHGRIEGKSTIYEHRPTNKVTTKLYGKKNGKENNNETIDSEASVG